MGKGGSLPKGRHHADIINAPAAIALQWPHPVQEFQMAVTLAPAALARVQRYLAETPDALGLRFGVSRTGCSGWQHFADLAKDQREGDHVFEQEGVRIYVDATSLPMVDGTQIDLIKQRLGEQFVFRNPNASAECGCGESFTTEADRAA